MASPANKRSTPMMVNSPRSAGGKHYGGKNSYGSSNGTPKLSPGSLPHSVGKKVGKVVRSGKNSNKGKRIGDGPEAELSESGDDDVDDVHADLDRRADVHIGSASSERARIIEGSEGLSVPKSEIDMNSLLSQAKPRPEPHKLSRGYEMITSPASKMVLVEGGARLTRHDSVASSTGFTDDSEWENVQFDMEDVPKKRDAYADVVKRVESIGFVRV